MNNDSKIVSTKYWKTLPDGRVQCLICPRYCKLSANQRGFCFVRQNLDNEVKLTTYGYSTGFAIDPIEKKPLYHFYPNSKVLSFGTAGCNLGCKFCQNWNISKAKEISINSAKGLPIDIAASAKRHDCKSVAYTYNEPIIFYEYANDTAIECKKLGIQNVAVTAGYVSNEARQAFFENMDAVNIDLKAFNPNFYKKLCSIEIEPVLDTINYLKHETNIWFEITTLLIPNENDSDEDIKAECDWIVENIGVDVPIHFSAFHPAWKMMSTPSTPLTTLIEAYNIAKQAGIRYVYTGNIPHQETSNTYCHACKKPVIVRNGYSVAEYNLDETGNCKFCGAKCAGRF